MCKNDVKCQYAVCLCWAIGNRRECALIGVVGACALIRTNVVNTIFVLNKIVKHCQS